MGKKNKKNKYCDNGSASMEHYYYENGQNRNSPQFNNFHRSGNFKQSHDYGSYSRYNKEYNSNSVYKKPFKRKMPSRPPSPVLGSEEHMNLKIKQTSAIIMRQLLSPDESIVSIIDSHKNIINKPTKDVTSIPEKTREKSPKVSSSKKNKRKLVSSNAEEIHDKIMHHLSKMNDGRRRNLIYSSESGYDEAIQQIVKQKRIEISRALRDMCSETSNLKESTDIINSIIPDIGIKIEDLPQELLEELQSTFDFECESSSVNYYHMNPGSTTENLEKNGRQNGWKLQECRFVYRPTSMAEHSGIKSFLCDTIDKASIRAEWQKWVRAFQLYLDSENINESVRKRNKLLHLGGIELQEVAYNIPGAIVEYNEANDNDVFGILVEALTKYFSPTQNSTFERHTYRNIKPSNGESLNKFLLRLRQQATKCSFGNSADEATEINIKDKIIDDWAPLELKRKLLEKERSLSDIIDLCQIHEQILDQSKPCWVECTMPSKERQCHKCELMGHFANKCKTKPRKRPNKGNYNSAKRGRMTSSRVNYLDPVTSDEEDRHRGDKIRNYECFKIDNGRHSHNPNKEDELIECKVGGIPLTLLIDSGSKANIINGRDWEVLTKRQAVVWNIDSQSKNILKPYAAQQSLDIRHQFQTTVGTSDRREIITSFFVVDEGELSILGKDSAKRLGVLKLGLGVNCIQDVSVFPKVKNVKVSLTIDKTVKPVQQPLRRVPVAVEALVEAKLNEAIRQSSAIMFPRHNLSHKGIDADQEKVKTILQFRPPTSKEEVRSFLGLVTYLGKFIPDLATTTEPLRQLTRRDAKFNWSEEHNNHFEKLKQVLTKPPTLSYFDPKKRTRLIADASPVALGAVLIQFECDTPKVVSFASKGLSDTERRYSQTEKESLALVWAVERFYFYLTGLEFELVTDHKPLEAIFKPTSRPPARIERWVLRLQAFKFKVIYQRGKSNIADSISRLCRINDTCTADKDSDLHIFAIVERGTPEAMSISEITAGSLRDPELLYAIRKMDDNSWETSDKNVYYPFRLELTNLGPILLRNNRIVIPVSQRQQILTLAHEGHPGETVMKRRLRAKVWWPLIDRQVEQFVKHCRDCLIRDKIPSVTDIVGEEGDPEAQDNDIINKFKGKRREDGARRAKENDITVGDRVVVQHSVIPHKLTSRFGTTEYVVTERRGNEVTVTGDGKTMKRHITHVKRIPSITGTYVGSMPTDSYFVGNSKFHFPVSEAESELAGSSTTKDGSEHQEASNDNHSSKGEAIRVEPLKLKRRDGMWEPVTTSHE
ncbi:hypothetical protein JTB14_001389 [Gonioctena quinquepunctata]|nr:hypothetical protein JTB14_001389 [Gonioctena quinquepunctata]